MANARKQLGRPQKSPAAVRLTECHFAEKTENWRRCIVCAKMKMWKNVPFFNAVPAMLHFSQMRAFQLFHTKDMYWK